MSKPRIIVLVIGVPLLAITILLAIAFLVVGFASGSAGGTLASGRSVMAHSDAISLTTAFSSDTVTIETAGKKILVQPTSLLVDGVLVANIGNEAADVQVHVKRGVVTFVADGTPVATSLR